MIQTLEELLKKYNWCGDKVEREELEEPFNEDARMALKVKRRSQRLFAVKSHEKEEEDMTFNIWKLILREKRTDWIVYVPGERKNYKSTFHAIQETLPLKNIKSHPENKKIFTFKLLKRIHLGSLLKTLNQKKKFLLIEDSCVFLPLVLRDDKDKKEKFVQEAKFLSANCLHISKKELQDNIFNLFENKVENYVMKILQSEKEHEIPEEPKVQKKIFTSPNSNSLFNVFALAMRVNNDNGYWEIVIVDSLGNPVMRRNKRQLVWKTWLVKKCLDDVIRIFANYKIVIYADDSTFPFSMIQEKSNVINLKTLLRYDHKMEEGDFNMVIFTFSQLFNFLVFESKRNYVNVFQYVKRIDIARKFHSVKNHNPRLDVYLI